MYNSTWWVLRNQIKVFYNWVYINNNIYNYFLVRLLLKLQITNKLAVLQLSSNFFKIWLSLPKGINIIKKGVNIAKIGISLVISYNLPCEQDFCLN